MTKTIGHGIIMFTICSRLLYASSFEEVNIAILDFEGAGLQQNEVVMVSDKFRSSLIEFSDYRVMERASMNDILSEQGLQQTGACNSNTCLVKAGRLLSVAYMVAGRLSRANGITAIAVRVIDVETGEILLGKSREYRSEFFAFVSAEVPELVREVIEGFDAALRQWGQRHKKGILYVEAVPEDGGILVDGKETGVSTPATLREIPVGRHTIGVRSKTLYGTGEVVVRAGKLNRCSITLERGYGSVRIHGNVRGMEVTVGNVGTYVVPFELDSVKAGRYRLRSTVLGCLEFVGEIEVGPGKMTERTIRLNPVGHISVRQLVDDAVLRVDGQRVAGAGTVVVQVTPGSHDVRVERKGYETMVRKVSVRQGDTADLDVVYAPEPCALNVKASHEAVVELNGTEKDTTPATFMLRAGDYDLRLTNPIYSPVVKSLSLPPGGTVTLNEEFSQHSDEYMEWKRNVDTRKYANLALAGTGQLLMERDAGGFALLSLGLMSDVILGLSAYKLYDHTSELEDARHPIEKQYFQDRRDNDLLWLAGSSISSILFRVVSYYLATQKEFR